jgi:cyclin H
MHDAAQAIVNDVIVSDIPMLYTPGQIGLAALMVANGQQEGKGDEIPQINFVGYLSQRFEDADMDKMSALLGGICEKLQELKQGKYGCGHYNVDMQILKGIHKKLKKVRMWGVKEKKKKRKKDDGDSEPASKKAKTT